jgi:putative methionine-R-sulfoxide reductase with GAF domain
VIPLVNDSKIIGILDVDSEKLNSFSQADIDGLEKIVTLIYS